MKKYLSTHDSTFLNVVKEVPSFLGLSLSPDMKLKLVSDQQHNKIIR